MKHRLIAINLPQFHPFPENDEWWGKGFTEWTNVAKARPRFKGHYQPHLPADTGFYDLRLPEARQMQADMAREAGIYGFCYYHYWFNGKQLMERPVNDMLKSGEPDFPFMLCWANENWARNWDGGTKDVLIEQNYSIKDDIEHMRYLCENVFGDKRYIKVDGKPFFVIYKPSLFPDIRKTVETWRKVASEYDIELYLGFMLGMNMAPKELLAAGFDVAVEFQPHFNFSHIYAMRKKWDWFTFRLKKKYIKWGVIDPLMNSVVWDYSDYVKTQCEQPAVNYKQFPCITPSWDNAPRRAGKVFWCLQNSTPQLYGQWLRHILKTFMPYSHEENFVFINAWNEWGEGNHLEPDQKWGCGYLEETKKVLNF